MRTSRICNFDFLAENVNPLLNHGLLLGLTNDDHTQYLLTDGTRDLTGDWTIATNNILVIRFILVSLARLYFSGFKLSHCNNLYNSLFISIPVFSYILIIPLVGCTTLFPKTSISHS